MEPGLPSGSRGPDPSDPMYTHNPKIGEWWSTRTMEHREFGDEVALEAHSWTYIKPEATLGNPGARPPKLDPKYDYVWEDFRSEQHRRTQEVWFPRRPLDYSVIQQ